MEIREVMTTEIVSVDKDQDLQFVLELMKKHDFSKIPVIDEKKLVGLITDNAIALKLGSIKTKDIAPSSMYASSVMERNIERIPPGMKIVEVLKKVGEPGPTMLAIVEEDKLVGIVTKSDLLPLVSKTDSIEAIMRHDLFIVEASDRIVHARRMMLDNDVARLLVMDGHELIGIVSDLEIVFAFAELKKNIARGHQKHHLEEMLVEDVMKTNVITTEKDTSCVEAAAMMLRHSIGALPIVDHGKVIGIITRTDLLKTISL